MPFRFIAESLPGLIHRETLSRHAASMALSVTLAACGSSSGSSNAPLASSTGGAGGATASSSGGVAAGGAPAAAAGGSSSVSAGGTTVIGAGGMVSVPGTGGTPVTGSGGASTGSGGSAAGGDSAGSGGSAGTPSSDSYKLAITIGSVMPGEENTQCIQLRLSNASAIAVNKLHNLLSLGSHHFIVSALTAAGAAEAPLTPCKPFKGALSGEPLSITQKKDDTVSTPDGVGYGLAANQVMHLELHYINTGTDVLTVQANTEIFAAAAGANVQESSVLLIGTLNINVPAQAAASTGPRYIAMPSEVDGVNYFAMTGHTHRMGTKVQVSSASSATATPTVLYAPTPYSWDSPEMKQFTPAVNVPTGGGFVLQCDWQNSSSSAIGFGESALQEMCFFWAYYYPKKMVSNLILEGFGPVDPSLFLGL